MPRRSEAELRDGARIEAKFALPQQQTSFVVSFAEKEEDFVADIIVELYGCVGYVRNGDSSHVVCQIGKALSCPTSHGRLRIKAQGPETWRNQEDVKTLRDAVRSGLVEAASGGAKRVGVLMKFSLHYFISEQRHELKLRHAAALIFSKQCPANIEEVNACLTPYYCRDDCARFVSECHKLVLSGDLLPHTVALPSDEPGMYSMLLKNKNLQSEVDVLRKQMEDVNEYNSTNKDLQDEVDALKKVLEEQSITNEKSNDEIHVLTRALEEQTCVNRNLQDEAGALRKQMEDMAEQKLTNKNLQDEVDALRKQMEGMVEQKLTNKNLQDEVGALRKQMEGVVEQKLANKCLQDEVVALRNQMEGMVEQKLANKYLQDEVNALRKQTEGMAQLKLTNKNLQDEVDALGKQMEGMAQQKLTNKKLQDEVDALGKQMEALEGQRQTEVAQLRMRLDEAQAQNTRTSSHHQRQRKKKQIEQIPRTPEFTD